jgi:flagellar biosynthesis protein FlhG
MIDQAEGLRRKVAESQRESSPKGKISGNNSCRVITVTSGKGGVGKTNIACNLALSLAAMSKRVLIIDGDLGLANVNIVIGLTPAPKYNLEHVIKGEKELKGVIAEGACGVNVIAGAMGALKLASISPKKRKELIFNLNSISESYDFIFIDTSAGLSSTVLAFILAADEILLITTPEPTSIADAYGIIKATSLKSRDVNLKLIVNRISSILEGKAVADRIIETCSQFLGMNVSKLGYVFEDDKVRAAVASQKPFFIAYPKSKATECIYHLRNRFLSLPEELDTPPQKKRWDFLFNFLAKDNKSLSFFEE